MKCDELKKYKAYEFGTSYVYHIGEVEEAIAELKARIQLDDDEMEGFLQLEEECGGGDLRNYIAELKAELAEKDKDIAYWREEYDKETQLTDALKDEIESLKASHYAESVDAGMRERRLRRALWLARAELCRRLDVDRYLRKHLNSWYNENLLTFNDACVAMEMKMCKAENKCREKAEDYK